MTDGGSGTAGPNGPGTAVRARRPAQPSVFHWRGCSSGVPLKPWGMLRGATITGLRRVGRPRLACWLSVMRASASSGSAAGLFGFTRNRQPEHRTARERRCRRERAQASAGVILRRRGPLRGGVRAPRAPHRRRGGTASSDEGRRRCLHLHAVHAGLSRLPFSLSELHSRRAPSSVSKCWLQADRRRYLCRTSLDAREHRCGFSFGVFAATDPVASPRGVVRRGKHTHQAAGPLVEHSREFLCASFYNIRPR